MNPKACICLIVGLIIGFPAITQSRDITPIVSTDWLLENLKEPHLVILDLRSPAQYAKGHIPRALSVPMSSWAISQNGLTLELPSKEALIDLMGSSGIDSSSRVVVANRSETDFGRADAARVAWTCIIAGLNNVSVLDGGVTKWIRENKPVSTETVTARAVRYQGKISGNLIASKEYVKSRVGKAIIVDARTPEDYFGVTSKQGHIRSAVNAPAPWIFSSDGTFVKEDIMRAMASGVIGADKSREVIVYCGVGGFASAWWYALTQILGYQNVKIYDGSFEEWVKDATAPVSAYRWN